jgi:DNA-binding beta-propeller fold protein YncE
MVSCAATTLATLVLLLQLLLPCDATLTQLTLPQNLNGAFGLTVSSQGRFLVIADTAAQYVRVLDMNNASSWLMSVGNGTKAYADGANNSMVSFSNPSGVAVQESSEGALLLTILVADAQNKCIRSINWSTWEVSTLVGNATATPENVDGIGANARLSSPKSKISPE